ncbi:GNAT family N-acetyltransferase [Rhizobium lusitanum]|uniref:GNAT superfamily N-acetyltransferase n=1 Tax=Rhizobium lusitanum TaxID=293958 RepID=A0A7X0MF79_9HYPH|nr:GNAT family N-acetyltransferase [Rhizobium lusitanum]MBB6488707.1 GNAT superfamily N-acetyltransferase [Rhizobium lusitanum]
MLMAQDRSEAPAGDCLREQIQNSSAFVYLLVDVDFSSWVEGQDNVGCNRAAGIHDRRGSRNKKGRTGVVDVNIRIKRAAAEHFSALQAVELASFETLRATGAVTGDATASSEEDLQRYLDAGFLYAAFDEGDRLVGYAGGYVADGWVHIGEADVHPNWQRKGIGRRLMQALLADGQQRKLAGATLTTDRFAPFNASFYASLGFQVVEGEACPERLKAILRTEEAMGFDPLRRVAMMLAY